METLATIESSLVEIVLDGHPNRILFSMCLFYYFYRKKGGDGGVGCLIYISSIYMFVDEYIHYNNNLLKISFI